MSLLGPVARRVDGWLGDRPAATSVWPAHWSQMLGHLVMICFVLLVITGIGLAFAYEPGIAPVVYQGSATLYDGRELPRAFASVVRISSDIPGGLLARRVHAASAHLLIGVTILHLARVLYTGAFQGRRSWNHVVGMALFALAMIAGWTGDNLPFTLLAGTSLRVGYAILGSVPYVGEPLALAVYGGDFPTGAILQRSFWLHVVVIPLAFVGGTGVHVWLTRRHTPTAHPDEGADDVVRGLRLWPHFAGWLVVLTLATAAVVVGAAGLVPWSDIELEGPYQLARTGNTLQPPWYLFLPEGSMRLLPAIDVPLPGGERIGNVFVAAVLLPTLLLGVLTVYPWIDRRIGGSVAERHGLEHPLAVPRRAAVVTFVLAVHAMLASAAAVDVVAAGLRVSVQSVIVVVRMLLVVVPVGVATAAFLAARRRASW